jgi:cobalt/nickel transport system ATP-binding protein
MKSNETVGIVGANGAGKSTLLKAIVGILQPYKGSIELEGISVEKNNLKTIRGQIGVVFQNPEDQLFMSNVYDDIAFGLRNYGADEDTVKLKIAHMSKSLDMERLLTNNSTKLSGGEKRLVAIATVLVMEPKLILFDEPTSFLDPRTRRKLMGLLSEIPVAKLIATHDLDMALELCDRVVILNEGKVFAEGNTQDILTNKQLLEESGLELPFCLQRINN